jgi:hypothetical protein
MKNNQGSKKHNSEKVPEKKHSPTTKKKKKKKKKTTRREKMLDKGWSNFDFLDSPIRCRQFLPSNTPPKSTENGPRTSDNGHRSAENGLKNPKMRAIPAENTENRPSSAENSEFQPLFHLFLIHGLHEHGGRCVSDHFFNSIRSFFGFFFLCDAQQNKSFLQNPSVNFFSTACSNRNPTKINSKPRKYILGRYLHLIREICDLGGAVSAVELPGACFQKNNPENWLDLFFFIRRFPPFLRFWGPYCLKNVNFLNMFDSENINNHCRSVFATRLSIFRHPIFLINIPYKIA